SGRRGDRSAGLRAEDSAARRGPDSALHAPDSVVAVPSPAVAARVPTAAGTAHPAADFRVRVPAVSAAAPLAGGSEAHRDRVDPGVRRTTIGVRRRDFPTVLRPARLR
ncbi:MAG: hypothetical protein RIS21_1452, partial [Planctomycetota bacterium]